MAAVPKPGTIAWHDLTVPEADRVRDFYEAVAGWRPEPVDMGGYSDWLMSPAGGDTPAAGVCHARGVNAGIPPVWLLYIAVADLEASLRACREGGGELVDGPRGAGDGRIAVIRDPAGAVCALYQTSD
jgi:uncharacterized protein